MKKLEAPREPHFTLFNMLNINEANLEIDALSDIVKKELGNSMELFVHSDGCSDFSCRLCSKQNCNFRQHTLEKKIEWTIENISMDNNHRL